MRIHDKALRLTRSVSSCRIFANCTPRAGVYIVVSVHSVRRLAIRTTLNETPVSKSHVEPPVIIRLLCFCSFNDTIREMVKSLGMMLKSNSQKTARVYHESAELAVSTYSSAMSSTSKTASM